MTSDFEGPDFSFHKIGPFYGLKDGVRIVFKRSNFLYEYVLTLTEDQKKLIDQAIKEAKESFEQFGDKT